MKDKLLIIGAGGHGKVIADIAIKMKNWSKVYFLDDHESLKTSMGKDVIGKITESVNYLKNCDFFVGIGDNKTRENIMLKLAAEGASFPILIHPNAVLGEQVKIGIGTAVMAGVVINPCTKIGKGCIINTGTTLDHDNIIGDFVHISPGSHLAGTVSIGKRSWLGIGSIVNNDITITEDCTIGSGTVVNKDIIDTGIYVGVPARKLKH